MLVTLLLVTMVGQASPADLALVNGKIWTVDPAHPIAQAVACRFGRILAVGSNSEIRRLIGPRTPVVDLHGHLVLPGFNDSHVHFLQGGLNLSSVQLRSTRSQAEFVERIRAFADVRSGRWITGGEWDHENWTPARLPSRQLIDPV